MKARKRNGGPRALEIISSTHCKINIRIVLRAYKSYPFKNHEFLQNADCRIVILHGNRDEVVPIDSAYKLLRSLNGKSVEFVEIQGGRHNDLSSFETYQQAIIQLFRRASVEVISKN